jgi:hypothetical protein
MQEGIQESEVLVLLLGLGALVFCLVNWRRLKALPGWGLLSASYCCLLVAWVLTVLEGVLWGWTLNLLEHIGYLAASALAAVWAISALGFKREEDHAVHRDT